MQTLAANQLTVEEKRKAFFIALGVTMIIGTLMMICPAFADVSAAEGEVKGLLNEFIDIIGLVFSGAGVVLAAYSVGQLAMAIKNEDADSKSRASTQLIVAVVLISFPFILDGLNLVDKITH